MCNFVSSARNFLMISVFASFGNNMLDDEEPVREAAVCAPISPEFTLLGASKDGTDVSMEDDDTAEECDAESHRTKGDKVA